MSLWLALWRGSLWQGIWRGAADAPPDPGSNWLLATGSWDDNGTWIDSEVWNDAA